MHEGAATAAQASAQGAPLRKAPTASKYGRLTGAQRVLLIRLYKAGTPVRQIVEAVGCHPNTVTRVIRMHDPNLVRHTPAQCHWPRLRKKRYMRKLIERGYKI